MTAPLLLFLAWLTLTVSSNLSPPANGIPKPFIIDTDIFSDVDDIGALAAANTLHNSGLADLQAVIINTRSEYGSLAASAINTHFSNTLIPIAALRPLTKDVFHDSRYYRLGEYASKLAYTHNFPRALQSASSTPEPVDLYRRTLASASNGSTTLVSIGFLTNIAELLRSGPDDISPLTGLELVEAKVSELVVMGGMYPHGHEFNFASDVASARAVLAQFPTSIPMTFSGYELGAAIYSGQNLHVLADEGSPVLAAYQWYGDRCDTRRSSWDPVTVLYAVMGLGGVFEYAGEGGWNEVGENGRNGWRYPGWEDDGDGEEDTFRVGSQRWLRMRRGVSAEYVGGLLERLYVSGSVNVRDEVMFWGL